MAKELEETVQGNEHLDYTTEPAKDGSFSVGTIGNQVNVHEDAPVVEDEVVNDTPAEAPEAPADDAKSE